MVRVQGDDLPPELRDHLFKRADERAIAYLDILRLAAWRRTNPEAPEGPWFKDFGTFKLVGVGSHPKTFLLAGQVAFAQEIRKSRSIPSFEQ